MSMLSQAIKVTTKQGVRACFYGVEGVGKSELVGSLNNTLFIAAEKGYTNLNLERNTVIEVNDFIEVLNLFSEVNELISAGTNKFENIVIDSASAVERMIHRYVIASDPKFASNSNASLNSVHGGYGAGYSLANKHFSDILQWGDFFVSQGINFIFTAHSFVDTVKDSEYGVEFNFNEINLYSPRNSKSIGIRELMCQFCDMLGYLHFNKPDNHNDKPKRVLGVQINDRYRAKNRYNIESVIEIPRDNAWNAVADVILECSGKDYRTN
jgi:hypothetical protein